MLSFRSVGLLLASLAALTMGCQAKSDPGAGAVSSTAAVPLQAAPPMAPVQTSPMQAAPMQTTPMQTGQLPMAPMPAPVQTADPSRSMPMFAMAPSPIGEQSIDTQVPSTEAPVLTTHHLETSKVRTISDERLPKWVPKKGRLTVVDSSDLAENLGLVPKGTTKNSTERISVADKLAEESAARVARGDTMQEGISWSYTKPGKFRSRR